MKQYEDEKLMTTFYFQYSFKNDKIEMHILNSFAAVPFWVEKPESLVLSRDDSGSIVCRSDGIPRPQIQWLVNGEPISGEKTAASLSKEVHCKAF